MGCPTTSAWFGEIHRDHLGINSIREGIHPALVIDEQL